MAYPRVYNAAADMVDRHAAMGRAAKTAFIDPAETLSYGELQARTNRMANLLATYGLPRESRVALLMLDGFAYKEIAAIAGISEGNVAVKINRIKTILTAQLEKEAES